MTTSPHIHILGASGSGTTTLGRSLAARLAIAHFDTDDFFWLKTNPPYQTAREVTARQAKLRAALDGVPDGWVLSGSLVKWGDAFIEHFDLVVFLTLPPEIRMARLEAREIERYGRDAIAPGGAARKMHVEFLEWAARYDAGGPEVRSRVAHEAWLEHLPCPVLRLESTRGAAELVDDVVRACTARA